MLTPFISWGMFSREGWVPEVSISFFSFFRFFARVCGVAAVCGPCFLVGGGWVPEVSILVFRFFVFSLVCAGWRWCAFRVSSWGGAGFPWVSVRFLVLCGVFGGRGAGRTPSFFGAGGANVRENAAKTRCFESEKKGAENGKKKHENAPGATPRNEGVRKRRRENVAKNTPKTRCFEEQKKTPETQPPR